MATAVYEQRRPERTMLYQVVSDDLETLYGAIDNGALSFKLGKSPFGDHEARHARKELEGYLDCGLLCRGFTPSGVTQRVARVRCEGCNESTPSGIPLRVSRCAFAKRVVA